MKYVLKWKVAKAGDGSNVLRLLGDIKQEYNSLEKARAGASRRVRFAVGYYSIGIYERTESGRKYIGKVVFDSNYAWGGDSGVMWIPKGKAYESYRASGVSTSGKLMKVKYRLT